MSIAHNTSPFRPRLLSAVLCLAASLVCILYTAALILHGATYGLAHSPSLQRTAISKIRQALPFPLHCTSLGLNLFPLPALCLEDVEISIPHLGPARAHRVELTPSLAGLARGELKLSGLKVIGPAIHLPPLAAWPHPKEDTATEQNPVRRLAASIPKNLSIHIRSGTVSWTDPHGRELVFRKLAADLRHTGTLALDVAAASDPVAGLTLHLQIPESGSTMQGNIQLQGIQAGLISGYLPAAAAFLPAVSGGLEAGISFTAKNSTSLSARVNLRSGRLTLGSGPRKQTVHGFKLQSAVTVSGQVWTSDIQDLRLDRPHGKISGRVQADMQTPRLHISLKGSDLDVAPLGRACTRLYPDSEFLTKLFGILRGGTVPSLQLSTAGSNPSQLKDSLVIDAGLTKGEVHIPDLDLDLNAVNGSARVENKILSGSGITANLGAARGWDGSFRVGLQKDLDKRLLDLSLQAKGPAGVIPPILRTAVKNQAFVRQVKALSKVQGHVQGGLELHKTESGMTMDVRVSSFDVQGEHARLPWPVEATGHSLHITRHSLEFGPVHAGLGKSRVHLQAAQASWGKVKTFALHDLSGQVDLTTVWPWLRSLPGVQDKLPAGLHLAGRADVHGLTLSMPISPAGQTELDFTADVHAVRVEAPRLPEAMSLDSGRINWGMKRSAVHNLHLSLLDGQATVNGTIHGSPLAWNQDLDLNFSGRLGPKSASFGQRMAGIPQPLMVQGPVTLQKAAIHSGKGRSQTSFQGTLSFSSELSLDLALRWTGRGIDVQTCRVQDGERQADLSLQRSATQIRTGFSGRLRTASLQRILHQPWIKGSNGLISGRLQVTVDTSPVRLAATQGQLRLSGTTFLPSQDLPPLTVTDLLLDAGSAQKLTIQNSELSWGGHPFTLSGSLHPHPGRPTQVDLAMNATSLHWSWVKAQYDRLSALWTTNRSQHAALKFQGRIQTTIQAFTCRDLTFAPLALTWTFSPSSPLTVHSLQQTSLCGITLPGKAVLHSDRITVTVAPFAKDKDLPQTLTCLLGHKEFLTGLFALRGHLQAGAPDLGGLTANLNGGLDFTVTHGRLLKFTILAKLIEVLNSTEILFGSLPDLENEGIRFTTLRGKADFQDGDVSLKGMVNGQSLEMGFQGQIHIPSQTMDITVLVAPFKTVDRLVKKLPLISGLTRGNLISIPVRISGSWHDPSITPLSPRAVSTELVNLMRRTLELPFKIFQPFVGSEHDRKK